MRIGGSVITLAEQSAATLQRSGDGAHVDLDAGAVYLWSARAIRWRCTWKAHWCVRTGSQVQVQILMFAPKICRSLCAWSVDFSYGKEFRVLPEGQTYRIYLEMEEDPQGRRRGRRYAKGWYLHATKVNLFYCAGAGAELRRGGFTI